MIEVGVTMGGRRLVYSATVQNAGGNNLVPGTVTLDRVDYLSHALYTVTVTFVFFVWDRVHKQIFFLAISSKRLRLQDEYWIGTKDEDHTVGNKVSRCQWALPLVHF